MITTKSMLLDEWSVSGTKKMENLIDALETLTQITKLCSCKTSQIQIMTVSEVTEDKIRGFLHNSVRGTQSCSIIKDTLVQNDGFTEDLEKELNSNSHTLIKLGNGTFYTTKKVFNTLCQRAGSSVSDFDLRDELNIRFHRDAGYVAYMSTIPSQCQVLFREVDNAKKIFAVFADRYKIIPQDLIFKSLLNSFEKEMGKAKLDYYYVSNSYTDIRLEFPKKSKDFAKVYNIPTNVVPGLHIKISDIGLCSFTISGYLRIGKGFSYIPSASYTRAHTKNAEIDEIVENVENKIFTEYTKIPERLVELLSIDIPNPSIVIPDVIKHAGIKKDLGLKAEQAILENAISSLNPAIDYTAYDIAMLLSEECSEFIADKEKGSISKMGNCSTKMFFYCYEG